MSAPDRPRGGARVAIESDSALDDIDQHFRVFAGPGAGKTHWLSQHIRDVLRRSDRLVPGAKVACVSYTNVAVAQILSRVGEAAHRVEAATIHAFLYRNVVRPYLHLVKNAAGNAVVRHELVDGHEEHRPSYSAVKEWHDRIGSRFQAEQAQAFAYLKALHWVRDEAASTWSLKPLSPLAPVRYLPTTKLDSYKPVYWERGIIDHDDVLYFAYRILEENPVLRDFLAARFPFVFVDEFQDTNPVQTQVVAWLAAAGSTVGVIGDAVQSIYSFQGARPEDFTGFSLPGMADYEIAGNRRSTDSIIKVLNAARGDGLVQTGKRQEPGEAVVVFVGDAPTAFAAAKEWLGEGRELVALAYRNDQVRLIRDPSSVARQKLWDDLAGADPDRALFLEKVLRGGELAEQGSFALGVREVLSGLRVRSGRFREPIKYAETVSDAQRRGVAVHILEWLATERLSLRGLSLLEAYQALSRHLTSVLPDLSLKSVAGGAFKAFAQSTLCASLCDSVRLQEEARDVRTIHQSKGDEFDHVLVCFDKEKQLSDFLSAASPGSEEHRVSYVAASRAKDGLLLCVPTLAADQRIALRREGFIVVGGAAELPQRLVPPAGP